MASNIVKLAVRESSGVLFTDLETDVGVLRPGAGPFDLIGIHIDSGRRNAENSGYG